MKEDQIGLPIELPNAKTNESVIVTQLSQARVCRPVRNQVEMMFRNMDSLLAEDHPARAIWAYLSRLDLSAFYSSIKTLQNTPGRPASDPKVMLALWIYATVEGVGSSRHLDRLCKEHDAYKWLCGNVPIDYHILSDFRVAHQEAMDHLLTEIIATMMNQKLVTLKRVAQDGTRIRAYAGSGSFHRKNSLEECLALAKEQVKRLKEEQDHPDPRINLSEQAASERAAKEREKRVQAALRELASVQAAKERQKRTKSKKERSKVTEARVSTTDPEVRVMKMPDGGYRPAYNVQIATDAGSGVIVGTTVTNEGCDAGQAEIMEAQVVSRSGIHPEDYLIDGGFAGHNTITTLTKRKVIVYAPVKVPRSADKQCCSPRWGDTPEVTAWRQRMETEEAKDIYRLRASTAEWANAQLRCHGLARFTVRGLRKVLNLVLLAAIAHNLLRWVALEPQMA
jgi:transposase